MNVYQYVLSMSIALNILMILLYSRHLYHIYQIQYNIQVHESKLISNAVYSSKTKRIFTNLNSTKVMSYSDSCDIFNYSIELKDFGKNARNRKYYFYYCY